MTVGDAFPKLMALILLSKTPLYSSDSRIRQLEAEDTITLRHAQQLVSLGRDYISAMSLHEKITLVKQILLVNGAAKATPT